MNHSTQLDRIAAKLEANRESASDGCIHWTGPVAASTGYGCNFGGRSPHRWVAVLKYGEEAVAGMVVDHTCHNRSAEAGECDGGHDCIHRRCINPDHIRVVTHGENLAASPLTSNGNGRTLCSVDGCETPRERATGWCKTHHRRAEASGGDPTVVSERLTRPDACSVDRCDEPHHALGFCSVHAARFRRWGDPSVSKQLQVNDRPDVCEVDGCGRPHRSRGWCATHYYRWSKYGDVRADLPIGSTGNVALSAEETP